MIVNHKIGYSLATTDIHVIHNIGFLFWMDDMGRPYREIYQDVIFVTEYLQDENRIKIEAFDVNSLKSLTNSYFVIAAHEFGQVFKADVLKTFKFKSNKEKDISERGLENVKEA